MQDEIGRIDRYWRAANYLTVANMYLHNNKFLTREVCTSDIKVHPEGHWGTCPGINFFYAHLNHYIHKSKRKTQLVIGPGHGGNSLLANLSLEQAINESTASFEISLSDELPIQISESAVRTEVNPFMPGTIYDGGELGYSLAVAYGAVLDSPGDLCVCVIGDGEAETGTISASWKCKEFLSRSSGFVLPILHMNEYKMGGRSIISYKKDEDIIKIFCGLGYAPRIVAANHLEMLHALDWVECMYQDIEAGKHNRWPMLIFKSPKGWTAPNSAYIRIENQRISHKNPLRDPCSAKEMEYLVQWLNSYHPEELFDEYGRPFDETVAIIPEKLYRLGSSLLRYHRRPISVPEVDIYAIDQHTTKMYSNITALEKYLAEVIVRNVNSFRIMSPDELESNLLASLKTVPLDDAQSDMEDNGRVMEILNENICQAWMQGYVLTGRNCLMISYEAFMPIIASMVSQYAKWIHQAHKISWRSKVASMTYVLTSLCWSNTYSHQNPEFINTLLGTQHDFMRVYMPSDANSLLACMENCLTSDGKINLIISSKQRMPQWMDMSTAKKSVRNGVIQWDWLNKSSQERPNLVLVAAGDYPVRECIEALTYIGDCLPQINIRFISVTELTSIGSTAVYPHAIDQADFDNLFETQTPIIFCFHGYPSAIRMLLFDRVDSRRVTVLGYNNKSILSNSDINKMTMNHCSRNNIVLNILSALLSDKHITPEACQILQKAVNEIILEVFTN